MNVPATQLSLSPTAGAQPKAQFNGGGSEFAAALEETGARMLPSKPMRGAAHAAKEMSLFTEQEHGAEDHPMAAAMMILFPFQTRTDAVTSQPDTSTQAEALSDADLEQPFVSILEGNHNDDYRTPSPAEGSPVLTAADPHEGEDMARMPQLTESMEETAQTAAAAPIAEPMTDRFAPSGDSCPLENGNKPPQEELQGTQAKTQKSAAREFPVQQTVDIAPERVLADATQESGPVDRPVSADGLFDAMVERMTLTEAIDGKQLEMQLKPEHLGKVEIQLSMGDDGLKAKIRVDSDQVKELISGQLSQLIEAIAEKGVKVSQVDVVYTGIQDQGFSGQSQQGQQDTRQSRTRGLRMSQADDIAAPLIPVWGENLSGAAEGENTSVEYRA